MEIFNSAVVRGLLIIGFAAIWIDALNRGGIGPAIVVTVLLAAFFIWRSRAKRATAQTMAMQQPIPRFLHQKLRAHYPHLSDDQVRDVERGLRQFFAASANAGGKFVAMPSKVVDTLWHEFILHTRGYENFCNKVFGKLLHHTPAEALATQGKARGASRDGLRRAWYWSCRQEGIDPRKPERLPLLFALDTTLAIPGGYHYVPDCSLLGSNRKYAHCATSFGCGSSCGGSGESSGDGGHHSAGDASGDSSGCSSSSCGSSCGGGGGD